MSGVPGKPLTGLNGSNPRLARYAMVTLDEVSVRPGRYKNNRRSSLPAFISTRRDA